MVPKLTLRHIYIYRSIDLSVCLSVCLCVCLCGCVSFRDIPLAFRKVALLKMLKSENVAQKITLQHICMCVVELTVGPR